MTEESPEKQARTWIATHYPHKVNTLTADMLVAAFAAGRASLNKKVIDLQDKVIGLQDTVNFVGKWVERGLFDKNVGHREALSTIAHYPAMPFKQDRWDVDHKPYAQAFYEKFPKAKG